MNFLKSIWRAFERVIISIIMIFAMVFTSPGYVFSANIAVSFTAPGDATCETCPFDITVTEYNVYYSTTPFDSGDFKAVASMQNFCASPNSPGTTEMCILTNLQGGTTYYIAITSVDAAGNESPLSNIVTKITPDVTPPERINDLIISIGG